MYVYLKACSITPELNASHGWQQFKSRAELCRRLTVVIQVNFLKLWCFPSPPLRGQNSSVLGTRVNFVVWSLCTESSPMVSPATTSHCLDYKLILKIIFVSSLYPYSKALLTLGFPVFLEFILPKWPSPLWKWRERVRREAGSWLFSLTGCERDESNVLVQWPLADCCQLSWPFF